MQSDKKPMTAWILLFLAALLTGILAGGVFWPGPALLGLFGKAAWFFPLYALALALRLFMSGRGWTAFRSTSPMLLLFPAALLLLSAGGASAAHLGGSLGASLARPLLEQAGSAAVWIAGFALLALFLFAFLRSLLAPGGTVPPPSALVKSRAQEHRAPETAATQLSGDRVLYAGAPADVSGNGQLHFSTGISHRELMREIRDRISADNAPAPLLTKVTLDEPEPPGIRDGFPPAAPEITPENVQPEAVPCAPADENGQLSDPAEEPSSFSGQIRLPRYAGETFAGPDRQEEQVPAAFANDADADAETEIFAAAPEKTPPAAPPASTAGGTGRLLAPPREYRKPDASLLVKSHERLDEDTRAQMSQTAELLEKTFFEFGIEARVTNICRGPVITQYEISVPPGIRLSRVVALQDNIALNLAAASVRIEAPIPGKSAIGIEVPNRKRSMVTLRDILESADFAGSKARIPLALGQTVSGAPMVADLAAMPHLIIAGTTGSGKSVCVNAIICSILYNMRPNQVRFILVDPKYVEMAPYNGIPHLLIPVINKPRAAILALKWLVREMEDRYQCLQALGARNIESYNERLAADKDATHPTTGLTLERMPYLILVIDELADLMLLAAKEIEDSISRLAAMSRAVGIHLIFATQRPSVDVLTGVIKNNFPSRIAFQVASTIDSRTILDAKGADKVLGKGDSLFVGPGTPSALRVQGAFLSEEEVEKTAEYLRSLGSPQYRMDILDEADEPATEEGEDFSGDDDPLYDDAVRIVLSTQRASASYVQRRLKVGYNRAARLVERMEVEGIIGPQIGSKPRDILVTSWP